MSHHHLSSNAETCHWGYFDAERKPVLQVKSGDKVTVETLATGGPDILPPPGFYVPPEMNEIHTKLHRFHGPHIMTGPIAIEGAKPGHVLEVRILDIKLRQDWGYNAIRPLLGTLPDEFQYTRIINIPLDLDRNIGHMPWGLEIPLSPFFGVMGVAPPKSWGRITSMVPRVMGGNIDNKELITGTTLYLPIFVEGGLFSCGDGHAVQGDGEVCVTAVETALTGTFEFILREDLKLISPRGETATHFITMAMDPDLDQCVVMALRDMLNLVEEKTGLSREDSYTLCSLAADLRITQTVNMSKGVHIMIPKTVLQHSQPVTPSRLKAKAGARTLA